jgi:hypothetical protein|tara:strand:- start:1171 stop:1722 length:552 start_codon:yes stop_codon:yes gene_type:complete
MALECKCGKQKYRYSKLCRACSDLARRKNHEIVDHGDYIVVKVLSKKDAIDVLFDSDIRELLDRFRLSVGKDGYILASDRDQRSKLRPVPYMFMGKREGFVVDHINHNIYDNRRINLRYATHQQNSMNNNGIGVYLHKPTGKWLAQIKVNGIGKHLGLFSKKSDALKARLDAKIKHFNNFANI